MKVRCARARNDKITSKYRSTDQIHPRKERCIVALKPSHYRFCKPRAKSTDDGNKLGV